MGSSGGDDDDQLGDEKDEADGEHSDADGCRPGEVEVRAPVERDEAEAAEEEDGAGPAPEAWGDFAFALVLAAADFADGLDGEALMVVDAAAKCGDECGLLGGVLLGFCEAAEDGAVRGGCGCVVRMAGRQGLVAGVENRVLCGGHALIPALWLRVGIKEQQRA